MRWWWIGPRFRVSFGFCFSFTGRIGFWLELEFGFKECVSTTLRFRVMLRCR